MLASPLYKHIGVVGVLYALLAAIAVIAIDLRIVLMPTACAVLLLGGAGLALFPLRGGTVLPWPAMVGEDENATVIVLNGKPCPFQGYEQELLIEIRPSHLPELLACLIVAAATLYVVLTNRLMDASGIQIGAYEAEIICIAGLAILTTTWRWFSERLFLRSSQITFGTILGAASGFPRMSITYQFFDEKGERWGGKGKLPSDSADNVALVLCNRRDPVRNANHGEFFFHTFHIGVLPGRRKVSTEAGVES
jgi:hypothetical protein